VVYILDGEIVLVTRKVLCLVYSHFMFSVGNMEGEKQTNI